MAGNNRRRVSNPFSFKSVRETKVVIVLSKALNISKSAINSSYAGVK